MLAVRGVPDRPEHDPRRLPRRRVVPARASRPRDAQGEPTGQSLDRRRAQAGRRRRAGSTEREVVAQDARRPTPKTGKGSVSLKVDDEQGGRYVVRVAGTDRFGNPVVADRALTISGKKDETKLRLLADRQTFKVGEEAERQPAQPRPGRARRC